MKGCVVMAAKTLKKIIVVPDGDNGNAVLKR